MTPDTDALLAEIRRVRDEADCIANAAQVEAALARMAAAIRARLADANPLVYAVLNGGLIVAGRLVPRLDFPLELSYLHATRYGHALQGATLAWRVPPAHEPAGRHVLVIDDILDEGHTLLGICEALEQRGAKRVWTAVLVDKVHRRKARSNLRADFTGLEAPDRYLFGCGMDYKGYWRNVDGIYAVKGG